MKRVCNLLLVFAVAAFITACSTGRQVSGNGDDIQTIFLDTIDVEDNISNYRASATRVNDLLNTILDVRFDWTNQHLIGKAHLTLTPYFYTVDSVVLDARGFDIHRVGLIAGGDTLPLQYTYDSARLNIKLNRPYSRGEEYNLFISYTAKPNELESGGSAAITSDKGLYFINPLGKDSTKPRQIWTQGETESSSAWFPTIDNPNERTTQEMFITVADSFVTLSNGEFIGSLKNEDGTRTDHWKQNLPHAPYLFMMAVGDFAIIADTWRNIPVNYYVEPEYAPYAMQIFGNTPEMMTFFSDILGVEYPWQKYSQVVVRDFVSGAMENTTASVFFSGLNRTSRELLDETHEDIIAHELVHHWFGDLVTTESWANIPLNESFATYGEYLWKEYKYGRDDADYHLYNDMRQYFGEAKQKKEPLIRFYYEHRDDMFDAHSYQKGGRVLHMLRKYVGDFAFFKSLNLYLEENKYQPVEIHHLRLAFEKITGEDLNWFFNQWFFNAGHPELEVSYDYDSEKKQALVVVEQNQEYPAPRAYKLPVSIDVYEAGNVKRYEATIDARIDTFQFYSATRPELINFDAENMLLATINEDLTTAEYIFQYRNAPLFLDRFDAIEALSASADEEGVNAVFIEALQDTFWAIRRKAVNFVKIGENDEINVLDKIAALATADDKSNVRAAAIEKLAKADAQRYKELFATAAYDSSYYVASSALEALYKADKPSALALAGQLEDENNFMIAAAVAQIYADESAGDKSDYYEEKLVDAEEFAKYGIIKYYGAYLSKQGTEEVRRGLPTLQRNAIENNQWWVRHIAMEAINDVEKAFLGRKDALEAELKEVKGNVAVTGKLEKNIRDIDNLLAEIDEAKRTIIANETNERLLQIYGG